MIYDQLTCKRLVDCSSSTFSTGGPFSSSTSQFTQRTPRCILFPLYGPGKIHCSPARSAPSLPLQDSRPTRHARGASCAQNLGPPCTPPIIEHSQPIARHDRWVHGPLPVLSVAAVSLSLFDRGHSVRGRLTMRASMPCVAYPWCFSPSPLTGAIRRLTSRQYLHIAYERRGQFG